MSAVKVSVPASMCQRPSRTICPFQPRQPKKCPAIALESAKARLVKPGDVDVGTGRIIKPEVPAVRMPGDRLFEAGARDFDRRGACAVSTLRASRRSM